jgi:insertion element IS1 protein InsB
MRRVEDAAVDAMWSFVRQKKAQRWWWPALDHRTGVVLAYVFGRRKDEVFVKRQALLEPFGSTRYDPDHWGAYARQLAPAEPNPGKHNPQKIERKPLPLRTRLKRLVRKTMGFSQSIELHDIVIGLFVNRSAFGLSV